MKKVFSLLLAVALIFSLAIPAFAATGEVTYRGQRRITITPATTVYTDSDMFDNFKGVMPGDVLQEEVKITNLAADNDYVKVYIRAVPHGTDNPLSEGVAATGETVASMEDFLSQLHMQVRNRSNLIFDASPDEPAQLNKRVYLGTLRRFRSMTLNVELEVPIELGNEYANRVGEVDWEFTFEAYDDPAGTSPKTGDYIMIAVAIMAVSGIALAAILAAKRKKKK